LLLVVLIAWAMDGPGSLHSRFAQDVARYTSAPGLQSRLGPVTEQDLAPLPPPVQRYLRAAGVVGRPHPYAYQLTMSGRIRGGPDEPWMPFRAEQLSTTTDPVRLFYMRAHRGGVPVAVLHRYVSGRATMTVKLAGLFTLVDAQGPVMDRSETVTVFNDMCLLAPATLLDPRVRWRERGAQMVDATFSAGGQTVSATLTFDEQGLLVNFLSLDRARASADGRSFTPLPFLTPVRTRAAFAGNLLAGQADAQWRLPDGQVFTYAEFTLESAVFNRP